MVWNAEGRGYQLFQNCAAQSQNKVELDVKLDFRVTWWLLSPLALLLPTVGELIFPVELCQLSLAARIVALHLHRSCIWMAYKGYPVHQYSWQGEASLSRLVAKLNVQNTVSIKAEVIISCRESVLKNKQRSTGIWEGLRALLYGRCSLLTQVNLQVALTFPMSFGYSWSN